jgi:hypothetical protein
VIDFDALEPRMSKNVIKGLLGAVKELLPPPALQRAVARLPAEIVEQIHPDRALESDWYLERHFMAWLSAAADEIQGDRQEAVCRITRAILDRNSARIFRPVLRLLDPVRVTDKGREVWRRGHTHGQFTTRKIGERVGQVQLRDHPYVGDRDAAVFVGECMRYLLSFTRGVERAEFSLDASDPTALTVTVTW